MQSTKHIGWNFDNSYTKLSKSMFSFVKPQAVQAPKLCVFNNQLAKKMGLNMAEVSEDEIALWFSGNALIEGANPIAQAYAGHQFGHFTMLGDGRAILLGEHITPIGNRLDIQLKGAGQTPYSRRGDGRATLRAMLREYLISEAMFGLKIPTSRSLAVVTSGEEVYREDVHEGAILTRIASSHIRVGTFEFVSNFLSIEDLQRFTKYVIERHYPEIQYRECPPLEFLKVVMSRQIDLVVNWMRVGFIHGVMNTDNMSVAGETFDYGPCAFMNIYHPQTVFSSIDTGGRYAFGNQPRITHWNLSCLAGALLPIIHDDKATAIAMAQDVLKEFSILFEKRWTEMMGLKLGFNVSAMSSEVAELIHELLTWMEDHQADYTNTFLVLQSGSKDFSGIYSNSVFIQWVSKWHYLLNQKEILLENAVICMQTYNPQFIPRNYFFEQALDDVCYQQDFKLLNQLLQVMENPYTMNPEFDFLQQLPETDDKDYKTYCGT